MYLKRNVFSSDAITSTLNITFLIDNTRIFAHTLGIVLGRQTHDNMYVKHNLCEIFHEYFKCNLSNANNK